MSKIPNQVPSAPTKASPEKIKKDGSTDNETALRIALDDARTDEKFMSERMWMLRWKEIDVLYQSPRPISLWEGSFVQEANVTSFLVAKHTNAIVPSVMSSIFYQSPFFKLRTTPGSTEEVIRQKETLFSSLFREMEFEETCWDGWFYTVLFGTGIFKWGVKHSEKSRPKFQRRGRETEMPGLKFASVKFRTKDAAEIDVDDRTEDFWCPYIEHIPNEEVLVDCTLTKPDIRKAKRVTHIRYMTGYELIDMCREHEGEEGWTNITEATIRSWFEPLSEEAPAAPPAPLANLAGTAIIEHAREEYRAEAGDPLQNVLKVAEHMTNKRITVYVQDKFVVRNSKNQFGKLTYFSSHWWRIPRSFWSLGIGHLAGQEQRVDQGVRNAALNLLSMAVNPPMLRLSQENQPGQNIRLRRGAIITVHGDDVRKGFGVMEMPKIPSELWPVLQNEKQTAEETTGADQRLAQGNTGQAGTSMGRTASGAIQLASAQSTRLQGPISRFVKTVMEPWIYTVDELVNEEMPEKQFRDILGDELGTEYLKKFDLEKYCNGRSKFDILAAQHLAAKKGMAQMLPLISQIFENQQLLKQLNQTGWTVDALELVSMFCEISEWTNRANLIRKMTKQEVQFQLGMQGLTGPAAKAQAQMQIDKNKGQIQTDINSEQNDARASDILFRHMLEGAMSPEIMTGAAGGGYAGEYGQE